MLQLVRKAFSKEELFEKEGVQQCCVAAVLDGELQQYHSFCMCVVSHSAHQVVSAIHRTDNAVLASPVLLLLTRMHLLQVMACSGSW